MSTETTTVFGIWLFSRQRVSNQSAASHKLIGLINNKIHVIQFAEARYDHPEITRHG